MTLSHALNPAGETRLQPFRLKLAEYARSRYRLTPPAGATFEAATAPSYLGHVAGRLKAGDKLEFLPECMSWYAEALVIDATRLSARIQVLLGPVPLDAGEQVLANDDFEAKWISPAVRFGVKRKADGAFMVRNLATRADAERWIAERVGMKTVASEAEDRT